MTLEGKKLRHVLSKLLAYSVAGEVTCWENAYGEQTIAGNVKIQRSVGSCGDGETSVTVKVATVPLPNL